MKYILILILFYGPSQVWSAFEQKTLKQEKKEAVELLLKRKVGFEKYQKRLKEWNQKRLARAYKQKEVRQRMAEKKEMARKNFIRNNDEFPRQAYRKFLADREKRKKVLNKSRKEYAKMQKEMQKVFENKKYRIDSNKEYKL